MEITGKIKCNSRYGSCEEVYEWMYIIPEHADRSSYTVHRMDKPQAKIYNETDDYYEMKVMCPGCKQDNYFKHYKE